MGNGATVTVPKLKPELKVDRSKLQAQSKEIAKALWSGKLTANEQKAINHICLLYGLDPLLKQVVCLGGNIYITSGGLKVIANRKAEEAIDGIEVVPATKEERIMYGCFTEDPGDAGYQHLFKATLWKKGCEHPFIEWGEADKNNVKLYNADFKSIADMAKTRAVNRVIRNAYSIVFTSLEEMGYSGEQVVDVTPSVYGTEEDQGQPKADKSAPDNSQSNGENTSTTKQQQKIHILTKEFGKDDNWLYLQLRKFFDKESTAALTKEEASALIKGLEKEIAKKK